VYPEAPTMPTSTLPPPELTTQNYTRACIFIHTRFGITDLLDSA
jgi:hypothetical protein